MKAGIRIYKTLDGRFVLGDHPDAAFLAFSQFDDVPDAVLHKLRKPVEDKKVEPAEDKKAEEPANKAAAPPKRKPGRPRKTAVEAK